MPALQRAAQGLGHSPVIQDLEPLQLAATLQGRSPLEQFDHTSGSTDDAAAIPQVVAHRSANPGHGGRAQGVAQAGIEAFDRLDQAADALLHQVLKTVPTAFAFTAGHLPDQGQVGGDDGVAMFGVGLLEITAQEPLLLVLDGHGGSIALTSASTAWAPGWLTLEGV